LGESIIPKVLLGQVDEGFDFGSVAIGADRSLPLTLTNNGAIPASLILNMTPFTGFYLLHGKNDMRISTAGSNTTAVLEQGVTKKLIRYCRELLLLLLLLQQQLQVQLLLLLLFAWS